MKTTFFNIALLLSVFSVSSQSFATTNIDSSIKTNSTKSKTLQPILKHHLKLDLNNFCSYLQVGSPHKAEGVYRTPDSRYVIALIKNNEKGHDYIGVVCAADNPYWKRGEVKFNFILSDDNVLDGYYYNSSGDYVPVSYTIYGDSLQTNQLIKVDVETIKATTLAWL